MKVGTDEERCWGAFLTCPGPDRLKLAANQAARPLEKSNIQSAARRRLTPSRGSHPNSEGAGA